MFREGGGMLDVIKGSDSVLQILGNVALRLSIYITSYILHLTKFVVKSKRFKTEWFIICLNNKSLSLVFISGHIYKNKNNNIKFERNLIFPDEVRPVAVRLGLFTEDSRGG